VEKKSYSFPLRVVFYQEDQSWVAHCLEFDLVGTGLNPSKAVESLNDAIATQVLWSLEKNDMVRLFSPAPAKYEEMFAAGEDVVEGELQVSLFTPEAPSVQFESARFRSYGSHGKFISQPYATV